MERSIVIDLKKANIKQQDREVLEDVNVRMERGEFVYLIGRTGEGKSSLLKTLYADLPLDTGTGHVCGFALHQVSHTDIPQLRRQLGIVFQDFNLLPDRSVHANLAFVLGATGWKKPVEIQQRIDEVLAWVQLPDDVSPRMPHQLSGGEQQRVVIARALLNQPQLLMADEPTGNLDPETADDIVRLLLQLSKEHQMAVIFATHEYRFLEQFPARIWRCHGGHIFDEQGF